MVGDKTRTHNRASVQPNEMDGASDEVRFGNSVVPMPNGCWAYGGNLDNYGMFYLWPHPGAPLVRMKAHRFAYEVLVGPIPDDYHVHHECLNPGCVNPAHLIALSPRDHAQRHAEMRKAS